MASNSSCIQTIYYFSISIQPISSSFNEYLVVRNSLFVIIYYYLTTFADIPVYRVGGDEFLVIVTNRTEQEFDKLVETLIDKSNKHDTVKLAVGTCFGDTDLDIRKAMHLADERMYKNKEEFYRTHVRGR